jgi:hypothetical protein
VGVVVVAALASSATAFARPPQAFAASYKTACCYHVFADARGTFKLDYGMNPSNGVIGSEEFTWDWREFGLVEYIEHNGEPDLESAETPSHHFAPVLYDFSGWFSESDEQNSPPPQPPYSLTQCDQSYSRKPHLGHNTTFMNVGRVSDYSAPNVRKAFKGHKYVLGVMGGDSPGLTPCGTETDVATSLEPPPGPNNSQDLASQLFGPFGYYVTLPPRNDLRHGKGASNEFQTTYNRDLSFMECSSHYPMPTCPGDQGNGLHMTTEDTTLTLDYTWFPISELQRKINYFKHLAAASK